jgi:nitroreductase
MHRMNSELGFIYSRRSVRVYQHAEVDEDHVRDLLEAAMAAPSAAGKDPWEFIVVRDRTMLNRLSGGLPNGQMLMDAALGIAVCGSLQRAHGHQLSYMLQDCSAAIENMLLGAHALGLGACWLGVHPREDRVAHVRSLLAVPDEVIPVAIVSLGWPAESPAPRTRYRADAVHWETW